MRQSVLLRRVILLGLSFIVLPCFVFMMLNLPSTSGKSGLEEIGREGSGLVKNGHTGDSHKLSIIEEGTGGSLHTLAMRSNVSLSKGLSSDESRYKELNRGMRAKIWEMEDQLILARVYLQFAPPNSRDSHLVKELKLRIKEIQRLLAHTTANSRVSRR